MKFHFFRALALAVASAGLGLSASTLAGPLSGWQGDVGARLQEMIEEAKSPVPGRKPVAVFDWDNTVIKNDIGDAMVFHMVRHGRVKSPGDWAKSSPLLSREAVALLNARCGGRAGEPLATDRNASCADAMLGIYSDGKLPDGRTPAWSESFDPDLMEPAYAWAVQLGAGYTPEELRRIARKVIAEATQNAIGAKQKIGTREYSSYIRIYEPIRELTQALGRGGYDVWISSASSQYLVEVFAKEVGVSAERVIGVRPVLDAKGRVTPVFQGCGAVADGNTSLINFRKGKRCWLNKIAFEVKDAEAMMNQPSPTAFAAGDSDTDAFFVKDAQVLRLAINRNKAELMCRALENKDGRWLVQPMFIEPKTRRAEKYECAKFGIADQRE
ncbi:MAG: haloacid dehalogenase-like hydrolase [Bdellovibrionales bacterium]|nr:haloacid dehalogenase-like hydrolase [Bdellovibrionales bacterium]